MVGLGKERTRLGSQKEGNGDNTKSPKENVLREGRDKFYKGNDGLTLKNTSLRGKRNLELRGKKKKLGERRITSRRASGKKKTLSLESTTCIEEGEGLKKRKLLCALRDSEGEKGQGSGLEKGGKEVCRPCQRGDNEMEWVIHFWWET